MKIANNKDAMRTAETMMGMPMNETPKLALEYLRYLSSKYGFCGETCITAWAHYAQEILGQKCNNESYLIDDEGIEWFKQNKKRYK